MNTADNGYCRLCAAIKPTNKLINLQSDENKRRETVEKLNRVNASTDFCEDNLPKTVCFVCVNSLDRAFDFVLTIEQAQTVLNNIFLVQQIKKEANEVNDTTFSDGENFLFDSTEDVKEENVEFKNESDEELLQTFGKFGVKLKTCERSKNIKLKTYGRKNNINDDLNLHAWPHNINNIFDDDPAKLHSNKKKHKNEDLNLDAIPLAQLKLSWKDYSWTCSNCETQFPTVDELTTHSMQYHNSCNAFRCTDCNIRKLRLESFLVHVRRHRKYLKLSCFKCHKTFSTLKEVNIHATEHKDTDNICPGCNTTFQTESDLNSHTKSYYLIKKLRPLPEVPQTTDDDLTCVLCKKTFKHRSSLNAHSLIHTERQRDYTCDKCGKCFLNKQNLAGHMVLHDNDRPFQCEICKASFKRHGQLRNHVGVHDNVKPFTCEQCGRCFRLQKQLSNHSIIHTDLFPHVCTFCNKRFRFKTILNQHIRQHTGDKPYSCQMCQRDFTNWPNYNKHMKRRHGMDMAKKKHTPDGVYPINPATGEIIKPAETSKMLEWKQKMMSHRRSGRPKKSES